MKLTNLLAMVALALVTLGAFPNSVASAAEPTTLTGILGVLWGDSQQGEGLPPRVDLYEVDGTDYLLNLDPAVIASAGGLFALNGAQVTVQGTFDTGALDQNGNPTFAVSTIVPSGVTGLGSTTAPITGSKPWLIIMCKFADIGAEPHNQAYFQGLFGSAFPGINDFWKRISYGEVNLDGTTVMSSWVRLPHNRGNYVGPGVNLQALTNDCTAPVDNSVNFSQFSGVSMMFNAELDGCSWGGTIYLNRDGIQIIRATWAPPWGYENQNILAHEVGHGFGLPHSSGPYNQTYDSPWDVMSAWPPCGAHHDPRYGCIGVETISYHRQLLGWIPSNRLYVGGAGTIRQITLERLGQPPNATGTYLMAKIPIPGSSTRYYTVEARKHIDNVEYDDYEEELIGSGVVIHLVDTRRADRIAQVLDSDHDGDPRDAGSMWAIGEKFTDNANGISIGVLSATGSGYVVEIRGARPANDSFGSATAISAYPYSRIQMTATATKLNSDPTFPCASTKGMATVWFKFTANRAGHVEVSTVGSNYDTLLGIWRGSSGNLRNVACDDNSGGNGVSALAASVAAGTTYYVEVAGRSHGGTLNFTLGFGP